MSDNEDARIELTILKIQSEIKEKVEKDLFRYYRNLGSIIIAVLASVGIFIGWPALVDLIKQQISEQIEQPVEAAKGTATKAQNVAENILARLEEKQTRLQESMGRADRKFEEMNGRYGNASASIDEINEAVADMRKLVDYLKITTSPQTVTADQIRNIDTQIKNLSDITSRLAQKVEAISATENLKAQVAEINQSLSALSTEQEKNISASQSMQDNPRLDRIVYVQFAGGQRAKIEAVADALREKGWSIPGEERRSSAAGKYEVRYFDGDDKDAAQKLADETNETLTQLGFQTKPVEATAVNLEKMPPPGIVELWLEIPTD